MEWIYTVILNAVLEKLIYMLLFIHKIYILHTIYVVYIYVYILINAIN